MLALGIAGAALDYSADAGNAEDVGSTPSTFEASPTSATAAMLWKDDIRWAQVELRNRGLYNGSLDGIIGPQTKRGLDQFQRYNGLKRTAALDPKTFDALIGSAGTGYGSSRSRGNGHTNSMTNRSGLSSLGN